MTHQKQSQKLLLPVYGMTCANCVSQVENALKRLPGVSNVMVDLKTNLASLDYDPVVVDLINFQRAVEEAGYSVPTQEVIMRVEGMSCVSCLAHVEGALQALPGVIEANVSLSQGKARVQLIPDIVTLAQMETAVQEAGYEAHLQEPANNTLDTEPQAHKADHLPPVRNDKAVGPSSLLAWMKKSLHKPGTLK